jgi:transcriptional regulator with XRE-family HTH domain
MNSAIKNDSQSTLISMLKERIPAQQSLVDVISERLNISQDAAYRRLRGEKRFDIDELYALCNTFNISLDSIFAVKSHGTIFNYTTLDIRDQANYLAYMQRFSKSLELLKQGKEKEIIFSATDVPVFHFMPFKELTIFKLFAWNNSTYSQKEKFESFLENIDKTNFFKCYDNIFADYAAIPSSEIWTTTTIDPIIRLLDFYYDIGSFEKNETYQLLCNQVGQMVENVRQWVEKGYKGKNPQNIFKFYTSETDLENSFGLFKRDTNIICVLKLFTINSLSTSHEPFCQEAQSWMESTLSKSILLTGASERERFKFFNSLQQKVNGLMTKI